MKDRTRGKTWQNSPPPGVRESSRSLHRIPKWLCRADKVLRRGGVDAQYRTHFRDDLPTRVGGQIIERVGIHGLHGSAGMVAADGTYTP